MPAPSWRRLVGYLPTEPGWWADRADAHFQNPAAMAGLVARLGLDADRLHAEIAHLSTGERKRLALIRMLAREPRVLLLDEPTSGLDPGAAAEVEALLGERLAAGAAMLIVTHDEAQAKRLSRRRLLVEDGVVRETAA